MAKARKRPARAGFRCSACGRDHGKWAGRCEGCGEWGSVTEVAEAPVALAPGQRAGGAVRPVPLTSVDSDQEAELRRPTGIGELDRVLGGGLVRGSLILLGGEPGIGKSTLLLELCAGLARGGSRVLYVCGEESPHQIRLRADRIDAVAEGLDLLPMVELEGIAEQIRSDPPDLVVVDSVQTLVSRENPGVPGSTGQLGAVATRLLGLAKSLEVPCVLVAHVNKDGELAGPKFLEHMVDVVLYFEGDRDQGLRFVRSVKNRFGPTGELGVFTMEERGLVPVENPSGLFYDEDELRQPGSCVAAGVEGSRCYLVEVQALVSPAVHAYPRRIAQGYEQGRLAVLASVLERRLGDPLSRDDICVKVAGGIKLTEPAMDLALAVSLLSSRRNQPLPPATAFAGEVGLGGEIRPVGYLTRRAREAGRLGFSTLYVPGGGSPEAVEGVRLRPVRSLGELVDELWEEAPCTGS